LKIPTERRRDVDGELSVTGGALEDSLDGPSESEQDVVVKAEPRAYRFKLPSASHSPSDEIHCLHVAEVGAHGR
jgi:hypothetical protein